VAHEVSCPWRAYAEALAKAAQLRRNTTIRNDKHFAGQWVAIPKEDFDALRTAREALEGAAQAMLDTPVTVVCADEIEPFYRARMALRAALTAAREREKDEA